MKRPTIVMRLALAALSLVLAPNQAPAQTTRLLGLDISAWQGNISQTTWNNLRTVENRQFIILRSSRGGSTGYYDQNDSDNSNGLNTLSQRYDDPYFVQNINRVVAAGMYAGSYHFSRPDIIATTTNSGGIPNSGADEADHFIQMAGPWMRPGYLVPVHDFEAGDGIRTDQEMAQFCIDFSNRIYERMGIRPAIYINGNYAQNILGGAPVALRNQLAQPSANAPTMTSPANLTLWTARWPNQADPNSIDVQTGEPNASAATIYGPWDDYGVTHPWVFWQYASTLRLNSFSSGTANLDADVVRGGFDFLRDQLVPAIWTSDTSGDWSTLTNWNSGLAPVAPVPGPGQVTPVGTQTLPTPRLPGAAGSGTTSGQFDTVILERPNASVTVTLSSGSHNIRKLYQRETLAITGGALTVNYAPAPDSTTNGARFSGPVSLSGTASFSVHTLQVDAAQSFALNGGTLTANTINLMPGATPAKILIGGDVSFNSLSNVSAAINSGAGSGNAGIIDLTGGTRALTVGNGTAEIDLSANVALTNGALTKSGAGTLRLSAANSYASGTTVAAGRLLVNNTTNSGTGSGSVSVVGGILGGTGTIAGTVTLNTPGTLAPGTESALGKLTLNSAPILIGTNFIRVDRNGGTATNDQLTLTSGTLNYGGTLRITNSGAALIGGEVFNVFSAPTYSGAFANTNVPALATGLNWYLGRLNVDGTVRVNRAPSTQPDSWNVAVGVPLQIPIATLLTNDSDPDGDSISFAGINLTSTNGISISTNASDIFYTNPNPGVDQLTYTVTDGRGGFTSGVVVITTSVPSQPATIQQSPTNQTVIAGQPTTFVVTASGSAPLSYQWRFNSVDINGANTSSLLLANPQANQAGNYSVIVSNNLGAVTSAVATLTVNYSLQVAVVGSGTVTPAPNASVFAPNASVSLTATAAPGYLFSGWSGDASGSANPLNFIFTTNKFITATFLLTNVDIALDNTNNEVTYTGSWQTGTSSTDKYLADYRFASSAAGSTATAVYRPNIPTAGRYDVAIWYPQGSNRATNSSWTITSFGGSTNIAVDQTVNGGGWRTIAASRPFSAGTNGSVQVSNDTGAAGRVVMADGVRFTFVAPLNSAPSINIAPVSQVVKVGSNVTFSVVATGTPTPNYQWLFAGNPIVGATASTLLRTNAQVADSGTYSVIASNSVGSVQTNANLAVVPLAPLWMQSITPLPDGRMSLVVTGEPGYAFTVENSTNLANWLAITNVSNPSGTSSVIDHAATNRNSGFYRARQ